MISPSAIRDRLAPLLDPAPRVAWMPDTRPGAVLVPILSSTSEPRLVFTRRSDSMSRHAGEISFPGGLIEAGEEPAAAALREAEEELGLAPAEVEVIGALEPVHTRVTGVLIVPFVGLLWADPQFRPNAAEIAEVLEFSLPDLAAKSAITEFVHEGRTFETHVFDMDGHVIWGATARILRSLLDLLEAVESREG